MPLGGASVGPWVLLRRVWGPCPSKTCVGSGPRTGRVAAVVAVVGAVRMAQVPWGAE